MHIFYTNFSGQIAHWQKRNPDKGTSNFYKCRHYFWLRYYRIGLQNERDEGSLQDFSTLIIFSSWTEQNLAA